MSAAIRFNAGNVESPGSVLQIGGSDIVVQDVTLIGFRRFRARRRVWPLLRWILRRHEVAR